MTAPFTAVRARGIAFLAALALTACGGGTDAPSGPAFPTVDLAQGAVLDIPTTTDGLHYVTMPTGPLTGKTLIRMRFRLDMAPGVKLIPSSDAAAPSIITLYFQREGDDWSAQGGMEAYRWYAAFAYLSPVTAGEHTLQAPLDGNWTAILTSSRASNPQGFQGAIDHAARVGFVLGGGTGLGHGVYASGPAKLVVLSFEVI